MRGSFCYAHIGLLRTPPKQRKRHYQQGPAKVQLWAFSVPFSSRSRLLSGETYVVIAEVHVASVTIEIPLRRHGKSVPSSCKS